MRKIFLIIYIPILLLIVYELWSHYNPTILENRDYNQLISEDFDSAFTNFYRIELDKKVVRSKGFETMFALVKKQSQKTGKPIVIVETGSVRRLPLDIPDDGESTLIFSHFLGKNGVLHSVDTDSNCKTIIHRHLKLNNVQFHKMNSIEFLKKFLNPQDITLLYLNSYDVQFGNSGSSARHHLEEIKAIFDNLKEGTIIAIDDNLVIDGKPVGKGYMVEDFLKAAGVYLIYDGYQKVFQIRHNPVNWED